eukprot:620209-Pyramimonas_sp.AAC.1
MGASGGPTIPCVFGGFRPGFVVLDRHQEEEIWAKSGEVWTSGRKGEAGWLKSGRNPVDITFMLGPRGSTEAPMKTDPRARTRRRQQFWRFSRFEGVPGYSRVLSKVRGHSRVLRGCSRVFEVFRGSGLFEVIRGSRGA